jgi:hypothetical protein
MVKRIGSDAYYVIVSEGDTLRREIKRGINTSSVLIADLSSAPDQLRKQQKGPRPAIMWEVGYAEALELGLVFICQKKDKPYVPAVLADYHVIYYEIDDLATMLSEAEGALDKLIARGRASDSRIFRSKCYLDRKSADLDLRYLRAKETIKILELNLETVAEQVPMIARALNTNPDLSVQILTLNPFSKWAEDRANQLAALPLPYRRNLLKKIRETQDGLKDVAADRWGLRIYDTFPTQIMFQLDEALIHSMISLGKRARNMLHFEIQNTQPNASDTFEAHFAQLWSSSMEYGDWYRQNEQAVLYLLGSSLEDKGNANNQESVSSPSAGETLA